MSWVSFVLLGLALAMDCFAISLCLGLREKRLTLRLVLPAPLAFGFFHGLMPLLGWALGLSIRPLIESFDHWVAFFLLLGVGGHMLNEAWDQYKAGSDTCCACPPEATPGRAALTLLTLAVATSLDALAVGLSLAFAEVSLWGPALIIAGVTFTVSLAGICLGHGVGRFVQCTHYAVALGGCVLIGIAFKILMEHGVM